MTDTPTNLAKLAAVAAQIAEGNDTKSCVWWIVSVAGAKPEIARFYNDKMYTVGCADPHELEAIELLGPLVHERHWPKPKIEQDKLDEMNARFQRSNPQAGYRKFL